MAADRFSSQRAALRRQLLEARAAAGGWPYYAGKSPRVEPTTWALLALAAEPAASTPGSQRAVEQGFGWLTSLQRPSGLLLEPGVPIENFGFNGLALIAAQARPGGPPPFTDRLVSGLLNVKGVKLEGDPKVVRQNSALQAWSWIDGTFSWIEPTAYCLIALKRRGNPTPIGALRIAEAEAVILDRVCDGGGWNYGNSQVLSQDLRPYVPTTALALLAMRDKAGHPVIQKSLLWLETNGLSERSALALSLAAVGLESYGRRTDEALVALADLAGRAESLGSLYLTATALYALALPNEQARAFGGSSS